MNHLGLFEGIGGFSLAARWANWKTVGWVEINPFCQKVLKHHFPESQGFGDIKKFSYAIYKSILRNRGIRDRRVDIITGGFPCQPYSVAGKRRGTEDDRHLWPEMLRAIREIHPKWVVGENVRGIVNWSGGLVFEQVQADLEAIGYEVQAFIFPACAVDAPHRRDRVWFVAYAHSEQRERQIRGMEPKFVAGCEWAITYTKSKSSRGLSIRTETQHAINGEFGCYGIATDTHRNQRCERGVYYIRRIQAERHFSPCAAWAMGEWKDFPTQSPLCSRNDGISTRLAGITFSRHRRESIQAYGNAIVPQVAYQIFKSINEYEQRKIQH